ncbi:hypothetical protein [Streptomyces sp. NBC_01422]|uniref:hypothetical protein n=1 Tax=Streptomyces sp. NBC_01422 TaxID=2903859 RepID=UPI002E27AF14|nr:hypothetical protein [Streptomyces sp. NBC_01422]
MTDTAVRDYVRALLRAHHADEEARQQQIRALEASGCRIIDEESPSGDELLWTVMDWRTGVVLAHGAGGPNVRDAAVARLDPDGLWVHVDTVDVTVTVVEHPGLPASLADMLQDWVGSSATPDEDVAAVTGWSAAEVARHRAEA